MLRSNNPLFGACNVPEVTEHWTHRRSRIPAQGWFPLYLEMQDGAALWVVECGRAVKEAEEEGDGGGAGDDLEAEAP